MSRLALLLALTGCAAAPAAGLAPRALWPDHPGGVRDVSFSKDGRLLATAGADGRVRLWDPAQAAPVGTLAAPEAAGMRRVVLRYRDRAVAQGRIEAEDFDPLEGLPYARGLSRLALSPDGALLAVLVEDARQAIVELRALSGEVRWVRWLSGWPQDRPAARFDVDDGDEELLGATDHATAIGLPDFDPQGHAAGTAVSLRFEPGAATLWVGPEAPRPPVALRAGRWELLDRDPPLDLGPGRPFWPRACARSPDGRWLVLGDRFGALHLWDLGGTP